MSNRSANLLLEVAQAVENHDRRGPHHKLCGAESIPLNVTLTGEIVIWARGYKEHVTRRQKPMGRIRNGHVPCDKI